MPSVIDMFITHQLRKEGIMQLTHAYDHFYRYEEITSILKGYEKDFSELCRLSSLATTPEGRSIWLMEVTNLKTGNYCEKPAYFVNGNIHTGEVTGSMVAMGLLDSLFTGYQNGDENVLYLLDHFTFYVVPRITPDGSECYLTTPEVIRSANRMYPYSELMPGLQPKDLDGDGVSDEAYNRISPTIEDDFDVPGMGYEGSFGWLGEWAASMGLIDRFEGVADIDVIREVTAEDMQDATGLSQRLYIAASDVQEFTDFYREQAAQGKRVYLLRYDSSEYVAADVIVNPKGMASADRTSTEMRQMFVNLGFDFISFTFKDAEGALTVVPAAMSPVDGVPDADPSREPTEALERARKTGIIVLVIVIVILLIVGVCLLFGYFGGFPLAAMGGGKSGDVKVTVNNGGGRGSGGKSADASTAAKRAESAAKRAEKSASAAKQSAKKIKQTEVNRRAKTTATQKSKSGQGKGTGAGGRSRSGVAKGGKSNGKARTRKN